MYGEVRNCDLAAVKNKDLIIIELKKNLSLKLILQGVQRQKLTASVYLAVPDTDSRHFTAPGKDILDLLKRLGLGLIVIHFKKNGTKDIEVLLNPAIPPKGHTLNYRKRKALFREIGERYHDFNTGGVPSTIETVSAYRLKALYIAVLLKEKGELSPSLLRALGTDPFTQAILSNNYYGWFVRVRRGMYTLSNTGTACFDQYPEQTAYFKKKAAALIKN